MEQFFTAQFVGLAISVKCNRNLYTSMKQQTHGASWVQRSSLWVGWWY